jgi:hypothetical protein
MGLLRLALGSRAPGVRLHRDLARHFPHLAERVLGLARGAGVPATVLSARLGRELEAPEARVERAAALLPERTGEGALLGRSFGAAAAEELVLRTSAPDNDFRSLEAVGCAAPGAWIGVNEHGLAAAAVALPSDAETRRGCAAPATLLVQECLQRFDALEAALAWCERRPAGGVASVLLADARGRAALVMVEGRRRRVVPAAQGVLVAGAPADGAERLAKRLREPGRADAALLQAALAAPGARAVALVEPAARRLGLARAGGPVCWVALPPPAAEPAGAHAG